MNAEVIRYRRSKEALTAESCFINELINDGADGFSVARARVEPGITTAWHLLEGVDELYVILQGEGRMELGNLKPKAVGVGDVVRIPAGTRQRIANNGLSDLIFLCICKPGFTESCYRGLEPD
jgi:mannose-6-phosphate isomerase-like protein (cupin superfamily)